MFVNRLVWADFKNHKAAKKKKKKKKKKKERPSSNIISSWLGLVEKL